MASQFIKVQVKFPDGNANSMNAVKLENGKVYAWRFNMLFGDNHATRTLVKKIENGEYPKLRLVMIEPDVYMFGTVYVAMLREQGKIPPKEGAKPNDSPLNRPPVKENVKHAMDETQRYLNPRESTERVNKLFELIRKDPEWRRYCTNRQIEVIEALIRYDGNTNQTAIALEMLSANVYDALFGDSKESVGALRRISEKRLQASVITTLEFVKEFPNYQELLSDQPVILSLMNAIVEGKNWQTAKEISGCQQKSASFKELLEKWTERIRKYGSLKATKSNKAVRLLEIVKSFTDTELLEMLGESKMRYLNSFLETKNVNLTAIACGVTTPTIHMSLFNKILPTLEAKMQSVTC